MEFYPFACKKAIFGFYKRLYALNALYGSKALKSHLKNEIIELSLNKKVFKVN